MPSAFNKILKPMIDLISDSKIRSVETVGRNLLSLTLMVIDFISESTQAYMFFNTFVLNKSM